MNGGTAIREIKQKAPNRQLRQRDERAGSRQHSPASSVFFLQRTISNQAVQRLFKAGLLQQPKLKIGASNDAYEQEADRVADHVMRMPDSVIQRTPACPFAKSPSCRDEEALRATPIAEQITPLVQRETEEETPEEKEEAK